MPNPAVSAGVRPGGIPAASNSLSLISYSCCAVTAWSTDGLLLLEDDLDKTSALKFPSDDVADDLLPADDLTAGENADAEAVEGTLVVGPELLLHGVLSVTKFQNNTFFK